MPVEELLAELPVGKNIRRKREDMRLSQKEFGDRVGMTQTSVSRIENGRYLPSREHLADICAVLECSYADLYALPSG